MSPRQPSDLRAGRIRQASRKAPNAVAPAKLPPGFVVTRAGSHIFDLVWDFLGDDPSLSCFSWNDDIVSNGQTIGTLGHSRYEDLRKPFQEAVAARWKYGIPGSERTWHARTAWSTARNVKRFMRWAAANGINSVEEITEEAVLSWLKSVETLNDKRTLRSEANLWDLAYPVVLLWEMRAWISKPLGFTPPADPKSEWIQGRGRKSEKIALIPKPVLDHIVGSAIRYIGVYSKDILSARRELRKLEKQWVEEFQRERPSYSFKNREYKAYGQWIKRRWRKLFNGIRSGVEISAPWNPDGHFLRDPDTGRPWLPRIESRTHLQKLENCLRTAAYIVIAFQSAARVSEVIGLKKDCHSQNNQGPGHTISGEVFKGSGLAAKSVDWYVLDEAISAINVLIELTADWRSASGSDKLFITETGGRCTSGYINYDLKVFLDRIDAPFVNGKPFPVSTHMFRVALAQWLAQEPYGEVAGAIHLKQLSTQAFRGYLRDDPEFQSMFEGFEVQAMVDHLEQIMSEPVLAGKMGTSIMRSRSEDEQRELESKVRSINFAQAGRDAPSGRALEKMKRGLQPVYKTKFTMCVFRRDAAECLKGRPLADRARPLTHRCEPLTCANAAITRLQVPAYLEDFEEATALAIDPLQSPSQQALHREQTVSLRALIEPFIPTLRAELASLEEMIPGVPDRESSTIALLSRKAELEDLISRFSATVGIANSGEPA